MALTFVKRVSDLICTHGHFFVILKCFERLDSDTIIMNLDVVEKRLKTNKSMNSQMDPEGPPRLRRQRRVLRTMLYTPKFGIA